MLFNILQVIAKDCHIKLHPSFFGWERFISVLLWTALNFVLLIIWLPFLSFRLTSSSPSTPPVYQPIPVLSHTYTLAEIHLQGVCELWCSLPQHCYALTRMATSSHHALFCVEPVGRTSCLSINGSNLLILTASVSPPFLSLSFSVPLIDATLFGQIACTHLTRPVWQDRVFARVCEGLKERKREKSFAKVQPAWQCNLAQGGER